MSTAGYTTPVGALRYAEDPAVNNKPGLAAGQAAPATGATTGFFYIPVMAGTPTGAPTAVTGFVPIVFDSTGLKIWVYTGGAWKSVAVA